MKISIQPGIDYLCKSIMDKKQLFVKKGDRNYINEYIEDETESLGKAISLIENCGVHTAYGRSINEYLSLLSDIEKKIDPKIKDHVFFCIGECEITSISPNDEMPVVSALLLFAKKEMMFDHELAPIIKEKAKIEKEIAQARNELKECKDPDFVKKMMSKKELKLSQFMEKNSHHIDEVNEILSEVSQAETQLRLSGIMEALRKGDEALFFDEVRNRETALRARKP